MKKLIIAAVAAVAFTAPALAAEANTAYPKTLQALEDCWKIQWSGEEVPAECKTIGQRIRDRLASRND